MTRPHAPDGAVPIVRFDLILLGFGHVGQRVVRLLSERCDRLERDTGVAWRFVGIATRRHGSAISPDGLEADRALTLAARGGSLAALHDARAGPCPAGALPLLDWFGRRPIRSAAPHPPLVVIETTVLDIERGQPAIAHVRAAIAAGAHVITANKGPAAFAYAELAELARAADVSFLSEGTVLDGIPVFNLVRETLPAVTVTGFRGVVNSTTNQILAALEAGRDRADALTAMQAAGIAEANAALDLDGWDAAAKTAALINVLMDGRTTPHDIDRTGIGHLPDARVRRARRRRRPIRLVASAERRRDRIVGRVAPVELPEQDPLARLTGTANALIVRTDVLGELMIGELDAGLTQTAYALLSDLVTIRRRLPAARAAAARRTPRPRFRR